MCIKQEINQPEQVIFGEIIYLQYQMSELKKRSSKPDVSLDMITPAKQD